MFSVIWSSCVGFSSINVHILLFFADNQFCCELPMEIYISPNFIMYSSKLQKEFVCTCVSNQTIHSAKPVTHPGISLRKEATSLKHWIMKQVSLYTCEVVKSKTLKKYVSKRLRKNLGLYVSGSCFDKEFILLYYDISLSRCPKIKGVYLGNMVWFDKCLLKFGRHYSV